jgi:hypothetical protein
LAWSISDELWQQVVIDYYQKATLCLECFLRMADDMGILITVEDIKVKGIAFR